MSYATLTGITWELIIPLHRPWPHSFLISGYPAVWSSSGDYIYFRTKAVSNNNPRGWVTVSRDPQGFTITNRARDGTWEPENDPVGRFRYKVRRAFLMRESWFWIEDHPCSPSDQGSRFITPQQTRGP